MTDITKASLFAIFAFFCMAVFGVLTKIACQTGAFIWVSFITYGVAALGTTICIFPQGINGIKSQHYSGLVARAIVGTMASFLYMLSMHFIPIVNSTLLFNTAPIFIPIISVILLRLRIQKSVWLAVLLGFIGILVIIKPNKNILTDPGNLIGLAAGLALAIAYLIMKSLSATETGLRIIFYYFGIGLLMQVPLLFFTAQTPTHEIAFYSALCGIVLMIAQLALIKAYTYAEAAQVGVYQYCSVVFVAIIEWIIWSKSPLLSDYIGFILVSAAGIFIITSGKKLKKHNCNIE